MAELLGDWRAAQRDTAAAESAASVAGHALAAAAAAEEAALEAEVAAKAALEAANRASAAVDRAKRAVAQIAEAVQLAVATAEGDKVRANHDVATSAAAESSARDRFHDAERDAKTPEGTADH